MSQKRQNILLLTSVVFIVYLNSFWGSFQFDDNTVIVRNHVVHSFSAWFSDIPNGIRPLLKFTYALNWTMGSGSVFWFHLFNITVHAINVILVYLLSCILIERFSELNPNSKNLAFITAILFAVHPVQTEAVTYISGRSSSLMAMFYLGSILFYDYGVRLKKRLFLYLISPALFIMAVATKETAIILPFALILWESVPDINYKSWKNIAGRQVIHWFIFVFLIILIVANSTYNYLLSYSLDIRSMKSNILSEINGVFYLLSHLILLRKLNFDPHLPVISEWDFLLITKFSFLLILFVVGIISLRKRPWLYFGICWFFLQLVPTNSILPRLDIANERHLYPAIWGLFLSLIIEAKMRFPAMLTFNSRLIKAIGMTFFLTLILFTVLRNHTYRNKIALWEDTVRKSPHNARAYNNLGYAYYREGRNDEAKKAYLMALQLKPDYKLAKNNLNRILSLNRRDK